MGLLRVCMEVEVVRARVPVDSVSSTRHLAMAGPGPSVLLNARRPMSLARAMAASAEGDIKELAGMVPCGAGGQEGAGNTREEGGRLEKRESSCLSSDCSGPERESHPFKVTQPAAEE